MSLIISFIKLLLVDCLFVIIHRIRTWQLYFVALELLFITLKFWSMNKKITKETFLILTLLKSLLKIPETYEN